MATRHNRPPRHPRAGRQVALSCMPVIGHLPCPAPTHAVGGLGRAMGLKRIITSAKGHDRYHGHAAQDARARHPHRPGVRVLSWRDPGGTAPIPPSPCHRAGGTSPLPPVARNAFPVSRRAAGSKPRQDWPCRYATHGPGHDGPTHTRPAAQSRQVPYNAPSAAPDKRNVSWGVRLACCFPRCISYQQTPMGASIGRWVRQQAGGAGRAHAPAHAA